MSEKQELVDNIANHIRKVEYMSKIIADAQKVMDHELKCLHGCLNSSAKAVGAPEPSSNVIFGQPKEKPGQP